MKGKNRRIRALAGFAAALMLLPQVVFAAAPASAAAAGSSDSLIEQLLGAQTTAEEKAELITKTYGATSVQYAIIDNGEITTSGHSGVYSKTENRALTADTMYGIGSVSKMFTATVIMKLVEEGRIDLDQPVIRYLPEFHMADSRYRDITMRMLLNHSSGLMGSNYRNAFLFDDADSSAHDELLQRLSGQSLKADPGAFSVYCNDGFTLAEIAAEKVTGKSFTKLIEDYISKPLSLENTKTPQDEFDRGKLAKIYGENMEKELPTETVGIIGTGGIYSTAEEMCRFAEIFMEGDGKTAPTSVLGLASVKRMAEPEYARGIWPDKDGADADGYGLGWDSVSAPAFGQYGVQELNKGGDTFFYHASLVTLPGQNMAAAVLSSGGSSVYNQLLAEKLLEERLEAKGELPKKMAPEKDLGSEAESAASSGAMPTRLMEYSGYYGNMADIMKVEISREGAMSVTLPGDEEYLESYSYVPGSGKSGEDGYFTDKTGLVSLSFVKESNGLTYMKINGPSIFPALGVTHSNMYNAQKLEPADVPQSAIDGWKAREGKKYYGVDEKYTSSMYLMAAPILEIELQEEEPGYLFSSIMAGPDATKTVIQIPGSMGRDLTELHSYTKDGVEYITTYGDTSVGEEAVLDISKTTSGDGLRSVYKIGDQGYAVWLNTESAAGRTVTITPPEKGAFFVYDGKVCVNASLVSGENTFVLPDDGSICLAGDPGQEFVVELAPFEDAKPEDWYFDAVSYLTQRGLISGNGDGSFGAEEEMSRAMLVTMLNKLGQTDSARYGVECKDPAVFADVTEGQWYAPAAAWAGGAGIVSGTGEDEAGEKLFSPDQPITREQLAVILYQYAGKIGSPTNSEGMAIREFADEAQVAAWARDAVRWAVGSGLISGKTSETGEGDGALRLDPRGTASRAEAAQIMMRFMEATEK